MPQDEVTNLKKTEKELVKDEADDIKRYLWLSVSGAIIIGVIMIGLMSVFSYTNLTDGVRAFGSGVLIAGGSVLSGGFLGFIFGIPSILQNPDARLKYNDNLVQISDWLTKIIVGVGLTQLYNIPHFIVNIGNHFQVNFGEAEWGRNVAIAIIGYFVVLGFLMIYFWTKTDYSTVMKVMDDDLNEKLEEVKGKLQDEIKEKEQTEQKLEEVNKDVELKNQDIEAMFQTFQNSEQAKQIIAGNISNDPQKNKWGGKSENNNRRVSATVRETTYSSELFVVSLEVGSMDNSKPLTGSVIFHLHNTFVHPDRQIDVVDGVAKLQLVAWGAFTVGIECDNGATKLEIDLSELTNIPKLFKER